ncbi:MAG: hypothetical protein HN712_25700, partial [Gemmatimonadetes bacterium]|nr:hypothetical protein [Gemmatimonadota bacterium]
KWRWSTEHNLVKRALTMDTWDFDYVSADQPWLNFQITDDTHWGIFHGDNSGYYEAYLCLSRLYQHLGDDRDAQRWSQDAEQLRERTNALCWNGTFYRHRVPLDDFRVEGVDETTQLSLSNPMAINRGLTSGDQAQRLIDEYIRRGEDGHVFAPWFSIDPPYPDGCFGDPLLVGGAYINGGIFPLVGGELSRAAFAHGRERFAVDCLRRYSELIQKSGETYLWYFPDGRASSVEESTSPEATATDGWGSSAMLYALIEGLAGVTDADCGYRRLQLSPRWAAADIDTANVDVGYAASGRGVAYSYAADREGCRIELEGDATVVDLHLLLPAGRRLAGVEVNGQGVEARPAVVGESNYADANLTLDGSSVITAKFA